MMGVLGELKGKRDFILAPSILAARPLCVGGDIDLVRNECDWIHVDLMDGRFVPNMGCDLSVIRAMRERFPGLFIDVHIMCEPAERFAEIVIPSAPDILTVHAEAARHIHRTLQMIREAGIHPGVSINPGTPVSFIEPVLPLADLVLVMTVNPGFGAQSFIPQAADKLKELVRFRAVHSLEYLIEVDGGVRADNAASLVAMGCDVLVAGSAVFGAEDPAAAASEIKHRAACGCRAGLE
ncbi:ribulose-phosphate 3-epimerase [Synergistales bacterium]|nr:ribulose-phosphate 3-epimerase [Synergistales bacterium]